MKKESNVSVGERVVDNGCVAGLDGDGEEEGKGEEDGEEKVKKTKEKDFRGIVIYYC